MKLDVKKISKFFILLINIFKKLKNIKDLIKEILNIKNIII